jgi:hypothetical protein
MLDAMSYHQGPDEFTIKSTLLEDLMNRFYKTYDDESTVKAFKDVIDLMFKENGGIDVVGSMANWCVHVRPTLLNMCIECIK